MFCMVLKWFWEQILLESSKMRFTSHKTMFFCFEPQIYHLLPDFQPFKFWSTNSDKLKFPYALTFIKYLMQTLNGMPAEHTLAGFSFKLPRQAIKTEIHIPQSIFDISFFLLMWMLLNYFFKLWKDLKIWLIHKAMYCLLEQHSKRTINFHWTSIKD